MADRELRRAVGRVARFLRDYQGFTQSEVAERAAIPGTSWMVSKMTANRIKKIEIHRKCENDPRERMGGILS